MTGYQWYITATNHVKLIFPAGRLGGRVGGWVGVIVGGWVAWVGGLMVKN